MSPVDAAPDIEHWTTHGGAQVYFAATRGLPIVDVRVVFDAGSARDRGTPGLSHLTNQLLEHGMGEYSADEFAERLDALAARISVGAKRDMAWAALRSLAQGDVLGSAVDLLGTMLGAPRFKKTALERQRQRMLVQLKLQEETPARVAQKAFYAEVFRDHPYGSPAQGTVYGLQSITQQEVIAFHRRYYTSGNAVIAIVGDLERGAAEELAERVVMRLPPGPRASSLPDVAPLSRARTIYIAHPSTQTHVFVGEPVMNRSDPDYFPLYVGNHILGGAGLLSRLSQEIRERRGMSYSVYCFFLPMERQGPFLMGLQTENERVRESMTLMNQTLLRFVHEGPTEDELAAAKKNITGSFVLRLDSNDEIAKHLAMIGFYSLPLDYLDTFTARVNAVTRSDILDAFQRRLDPQRMVAVIVGGVEQGAALSLGGQEG